MFYDHMTNDNTPQSCPPYGTRTNMRLRLMRGDPRFPASASIACSLKSSPNREWKYGQVPYFHCAQRCLLVSTLAVHLALRALTFLVLQRGFATDRPRDCDSLVCCYISTNAKQNHFPVLYASYV